MHIIHSSYNQCNYLSAHAHDKFRWLPQTDKNVVKQSFKFSEFGDHFMIKYLILEILNNSEYF